MYIELIDKKFEDNSRCLYQARKISFSDPL